MHRQRVEAGGKLAAAGAVGVVGALGAIVTAGDKQVVAPEIEQV